MDEDICLVSLLKLLLQHRNENNTPGTTCSNSTSLFGNTIILKFGTKLFHALLISTYTKNFTSKTGLNITKNKITNHSNRASSASQLSNNL